MNYNYVSHSHCYETEKPPCGLKGNHCCLCDILTKKAEPVRGGWEEELDKYECEAGMMMADHLLTNLNGLKHVIRSIIAHARRDGYHEGVKASVIKLERI